MYSLLLLKSAAMHVLNEAPLILIPGTSIQILFDIIKLKFLRDRQQWVVVEMAKSIISLLMIFQMILLYKEGYRILIGGEVISLPGYTVPPEKEFLFHGFNLNEGEELFRSLSSFQWWGE